MAANVNRWGEATAAYCDAVVAELRPRMVLLYGSQATGEAGPHSDVNIIVVSDDLPADISARYSLLNHQLNQTGPPIEALGYTTAEFERMLRRGRLRRSTVSTRGLCCSAKTTIARCARSSTRWSSEASSARLFPGSFLRMSRRLRARASRR